MTSIPDLASRPAFKLDMICQKLQQDTGVTEGSELSPANTGETRQPELSLASCLGSNNSQPPRLSFS